MKNRVCGGSDEIMVIIEIYEVISVVHFVSEGQIIQPPAVLFGCVPTERKVYLSWSAVKWTTLMFSFQSIINVAHSEEFSLILSFFLKMYPLDSRELSEYCYCTEFNILI
jgi:hypothetical protein